MDLQNLLRARESATIRELARDLGVSTRTVIRDLATLREHGVPIETESGPGGGVRLERDRGVVAVHFALDELIALWLSATLSASAMSAPWSEAAKRGLNKVLASLPRDRARTLRALVKRVVVGRPASPRIYAELGPIAPDLLTQVERCFTKNRCLAFDYVDRHGKATHRTVEPHGLVVETPAWYLLCRDVEKSTPRLFRIDRIRRARMLDERPFQPDFVAVFDEWRKQHAASA